MAARSITPASTRSRMRPLPTDGVAAINRARRDGPQCRHQLRRQVRVVSRAAGDRRRVLPRGPRPLFHQQPAAGNRHAGFRAHRRLDAHGPVVQGVSQPGQRRRKRQSGLPLLYSAGARQFAFLFRLAGRVQPGRAKDGDRSELQRLRVRVAQRVLRDASGHDDRCLSRRDRAGLPAVEPAHRLQPSLHGVSGDQGADDRDGLCGGGLRAERGDHVRAVRGHGARSYSSRGPARPAARSSATARARLPPPSRVSSRPPTASTSARAPAPERSITFSRDRPPALQSTLWATALGNQIVSVPFANALATPVTIWVVAGPYATTQQTALTLWQTAQQIYADERLGVQLSPVEIVDATANAKAATLRGVHLRRRQRERDVDRGRHRRASRPHQRLPGQPGRRLDVARQRVRHRRRLCRHRVRLRRGAAGA